MVEQAVAAFSFAAVAWLAEHLVSGREIFGDKPCIKLRAEASVCAEKLPAMLAAVTIYVIDCEIPDSTTAGATR